MADKTIKERLAILETKLDELNDHFNNHLSQHKWLVRTMVGAIIMVGINWGWDLILKIIQIK